MRTPELPERDDAGLRFARSVLAGVVIIVPASLLKGVGVPPLLVAACVLLVPVVAAATHRFAHRWSQWRRALWDACTIGALLVYGIGRDLDLLEALGLGAVIVALSIPLTALSNAVSLRRSSAPR